MQRKGATVAVDTEKLRSMVLDHYLRGEGVDAPLPPVCIQAGLRDAADEIDSLRAQLAEAEAKYKYIRTAVARESDAICQVLGKALGCPRYMDDQVNFPGSTEANGVFVGEHVAVTLANAVAAELAEARANAVPWRKGNDNIPHGETVFAVMDFSAGVNVVRGTRDGYGIYHDQRWTDFEHVVRWCLESDLIPTAAKAEVKL